jgi:hypothetical protein
MTILAIIAPSQAIANLADRRVELDRVRPARIGVSSPAKES